MHYEIVVIGGGHAGVESAIAAAKCGNSVLMVTSNLEFIGEMPCNPAIGGVAKGNIVREIDALGGIMAMVSDRAGIQFRMLNKSKGFAVWGPRAQTDRFLYRRLAREALESTKHVSILQGMVENIDTSDSKVCGIVMETGLYISCSAVIVTTGTFLNGLAHVGKNQIPCGRYGELSSLSLSDNLQKLGLCAGRLKTGTPARIRRDSIDYSVLTAQPGDEDPQPFSFQTRFPLVNSAQCWMLKTTPEVHKIVFDNLDKSPLYGLKTITGIGPRYCPSIEDKLLRFGEREGHILFLEPEGLGRQEMYLNGFSTSLPADVQIEMLRALPGFKHAQIMKPAYAIEYDFFDPTLLFATLESKIVPGLYCAGQVNGTSGYEEAAGQGLVAGINAARKIRGEDPFILGRNEAYIGVLIDDLVSKGTAEPYRMFTSRAEYRLLLRQDNADERLMPRAFAMGLISETVLRDREQVWDLREKLKETIRETVVTEEEWSYSSFAPLKENCRADRLLKRPEVGIADLGKYTSVDLSSYNNNICFSAEADIVYEGFIAKQKEQFERTVRFESMEIPESVDYHQISGLLHESREKLTKIKPQTIGQASRISGVTPADLSVILVYLSSK